MRTHHTTDPLTPELVERGEELAKELFGSQAKEVPVQTLPTLQRALAVNNRVTRPPGRVARKLVEHHHEIMRLTQEHNLAIRFLGFGALPQEPIVFAGPDCDWVLINAAYDPLYEHFDHYLPVPAREKRKLVGMKNVGVSFSDSVVAHALPEGALKDGEKLSLNLVKPLPAPQVTSRLRFLDRNISKLRQATEAAVRGIAVAGAALSAGALAVPVLAAAALPAAAAPLALIDPVLLGVEVVDGWETADSRPVGAFYYLTHWHWPLEVNST